MANTAANVTTGAPKISGGVYVAPKGTTDPEGTSVVDNSAFKCLGFVSDAGMKNDNSETFTEIKAWGGVKVYKSLTDMTDDFQLALIETMNEDVLKTVYGESNVTKSGDIIKVDVKAENPTEMVWVFELALRDGAFKQIFIADGAITKREAITYNDTDAVAYGITVSAYPDSTGSTHKEYIKK